MAGEMPKIEHMWAYLSVDPTDGNEGVIGMTTPAGWMPFVCADMDRVKSLRPFAEEIAKYRKMTVRLAKFTVREDVEVVDG